jgi:hypothetical protein
MSTNAKQIPFFASSPVYDRVPRPDNNPNPSAFLTVLLTPGQMEELADRLAEKQGAQIEAAVQQIFEKMNDPMREEPLIASAGYWANRKGKANGKTYSEATFRRWVKENGVTPIRQDGGTFYTKEQARKWLFG